MHIKQVYFVFSKQEGNISLPALPTILFQKIKTSCVRMTKKERAELWVKNNLFNVFVMYALGSVHEKFDV